MLFYLSGSLNLILETPAKLAYMAHLKHWAYAQKTRLTICYVFVFL